MKALLLALALVVGSPNPIIVPGAAPIGPGGVVSTDWDLNGNDIKNPDDILHDSAATDAAPRNLAITSQAAMRKIAAANNDGGNICGMGASGNNDVGGVTKAATTGDTVTFAYCLADCTCSSVTLTEGDGTGGTYDCDGAADDATCVANLIATQEANATLGPLVGAVTRVGETTMFYPEGNAIWLKVTPSDGTNTVVSRGTDGQLLVGDGAQATPGLSFLGDTDTGINHTAANTFSFITNGSVRMTFNTGANPACQGLSAFASSPMAMQGSDADDALAEAWKFYNYYTLTNAAAKIATFYNDNATTLKAFIGLGGGYFHAPQTITCADSGDANHSTCGGAQTILSNVVQLVCSDAHGCTLTLAETNFSATVTGDVRLIGPASSHVDVDDSAGVVELAGGVSFAMDALDTLTLTYAPAATTWVEASRAAN